jgi:hypothetical protein
MFYSQMKSGANARLIALQELGGRAAAIGGSQSLDPPPGPLLGARNSTIVRLMSALAPKAGEGRITSIRFNDFR